MKQLAEAIIGISIGAILGIIFVVFVVRVFGWLADLIIN
jgi:hypothetical protein